MKIFLLIIVFLLLGAFFIISNNNLALIVPKNIDIFIVKYIGWFSDLSQNIKSLTGYAIKLDWLP